MYALFAWVSVRRRNSDVRIDHSLDLRRHLTRAHMAGGKKGSPKASGSPETTSEEAIDSMVSAFMSEGVIAIPKGAATKVAHFLHEHFEIKSGESAAELGSDILASVAEDALSDAPKSVRALFKTWGAAAAGEVPHVTSTDTPLKTKSKISFQPPAPPGIFKNGGGTWLMTQDSPGLSESSVPVSSGSSTNGKRKISESEGNNAHETIRIGADSVDRSRCGLRGHATNTVAAAGRRWFNACAYGPGLRSRSCTCSL